MKRLAWVLSLSLCICLLAGCGAASGGAAAPSGSGEMPPKETGEAAAWLTVRVVDGAESGELLLAGESADEVYRLSAQELDGIPFTLNGEESDPSVLEDGMTLEIAYNGAVQETWPARLGQIFSVAATRIGGGYYDLAGLYLQVLEDLWDRDAGLNGGITAVSVDLSQAPGDLTEAEKEVIAWIFACRHGVEGLTLPYEELAEQGWLTDVEWDSRPEDAPAIYQWEDGVLFTITAADGEENEVYSLPVLKFHAEKWRSPLGAYFFRDCSCVWPELGSWSEYRIGGEAIS